MPAFTEWFCGFCNPSCQRRGVGDPVTTGYVRQQAALTMPRGWFKIPENGGDIACGRCEASKERLAANGIADEHPALAAIAGLAGSAPGTEVRVGSVSARNTEGEAGWPSRTSPFSVQRESEDARRVGPADDDGVRTHGD